MTQLFALIWIMNKKNQKETKKEAKESLICFFDKNAPLRKNWIKKNNYYNKLMHRFVSFHVPEKSNILEIGCGTGNLLSSLNPGKGVGIDFSPGMIKIASKKYPRLKFLCVDVHDFDTREKFDYIIISDTIGYFADIQRVFKNLKKNCTSKTRIIITSYNFLWEGILKLSELFGLKMKQPFTNWLNTEDISNLLELEGFEVVKKKKIILMPKYIPVISYLLNKYLAHFPIINNLCLVNAIIARAKNTEPKKEKSVSIIIPARNEEGNIENALKKMPRFGKNQEIIFIEGNSKDGTYAEIKRVAKKYKGKWDIRYAQQEGIGKGDAVRKGFGMAKGDLLMILDADLTVAPSELPKFYEAIASGKGEFINGCRLVYPLEKESMRSLNIFGNKMFSLAFTWILEQRFKDTLCGTKVISKQNYKILEKNRHYFGEFDPFGDYDLIFGASKMDLKIVEIPIRYRERTYGDTNINRISHGWLLIKMCLFSLRKIKFI